jgi:hypothetical protein
MSSFLPSDEGQTRQVARILDFNDVAYSNGGTISQTVGATVRAGVVYTLPVGLGWRKAGSRSLRRYGAAGQGLKQFLSLAWLPKRGGHPRGRAKSR